LSPPKLNDSKLFTKRFCQATVEKLPVRGRHPMLAESTLWWFVECSKNTQCRRWTIYDYKVQQGAAYCI